MRIISGKYKGVPLVSFQASHLRPTTDRVKETLFNIWQGEVEQARVLDLFCGTGSLGLEALSRDAREVLFVDKSRQSLEILRKNLTKLKIQEGVKVIQKDVFAFLNGYEGEPFDLILIDPPFTEKIAHDVMNALAKSSLFKESTLISIESGHREKIEDCYPPLTRYDGREFGDKMLSLFQMQEPPP